MRNCWVGIVKIDYEMRNVLIILCIFYFISFVVFVLNYIIVKNVCNVKDEVVKTIICTLLKMVLVQVGIGVN